MKVNKIRTLYKNLTATYGCPATYWPNWCAQRKSVHDREAIIIGAILTQRTSWYNADLAIKNLQAYKLLSIKKIAGLKNLERLTSLIRPAGFYTTKPRYLYGLCSFIIKECSGVKTLMKKNADAIRQQLLELYGIGQETADTILLYGLDKPSFIIDEYTKKFVRKYKLARTVKYNGLKRVFETCLPRSYQLFQNFHALIIIDQKGVEKSRMSKL